MNLDPIFSVCVVNLMVWLISLSYVSLILRAPFYHPISLLHLYHFLGFVYRPFILSLSKASSLWTYVGIYPDPDTLYRVSAVSSLALISATVGFSISENNTRVPVIALPRIVIARRLGFVATASCLALLGLISTYVSFHGAGLRNVMAYTTSVDAQGGQRLEGPSGYITALAEFLPPLCVVLYLIPSSRRASYVLITGFVILRSYLGASRGEFIFALLGVLCASLVVAGRRFPRTRLVAALVAVGFLFDVVGSDRLAVRRIVSGEASIANVLSNYRSSRGQGGLSNDFQEFDCLAAILSVVPRQTGWSYGTQFLRLLIWPIPRQIWSDKPVYTSTINLTKFGGFRFLTTTLYGDFYMVLGSFAVMIMMMALSFGFSTLYKLAVKTSDALVFMSFWAFLMYIPILFRDGPVSFVYFFLTGMVGILCQVRLGGMSIWRRS